MGKLSIALALVALSWLTPAFTALYSDDFNHDLGNNLNGTTLNNAGGGSETVTWTTIPGATGFVVLGNPSPNADFCGASVGVAYVPGGSNPNDQSSSAVTSIADGGPMVRWSSSLAAGNFYALYRTGTVGQIYKVANGVTFTQLGSNGSATITSSDTIKLTAIGTAITAYVNGTLDISTTDSTYTAGAPGMFDGGHSCGGTHEKFTNFLAESAGGGGATVPAAIFNSPIRGGGMAHR